jgi:hypothetical protein
LFLIFFMFFSFLFFMFLFCVGWRVPVQKTQPPRVPEHVAEVEWFVTQRATKSHRAVNEFSNVATVQRLSPVRYIRPKRSAPRSSSLSPHVNFYALGLVRTYGGSET